MSKPFRASEFTSYAHVYPSKSGPPLGSADDKARFCNAFVHLVESDFSEAAFTNSLYERLRNTFGHIAHYNRHGFYGEWFSSTARKVEFLQVSAGYRGLYSSLGFAGDPKYTFVDAEKAIAKWVRETQVMEKYVRRLVEEKDAADRATYERLKERYG